ncbi:hypothetical protein M9458_026393, partial [Cirrhinus mrigala]
MPEPTADGEPEPAAVDEPLPHGVTEQRIATDPGLHMMSVQVFEPATTPTTRENAEASVIAERSSAQCNMAEGEMVADLGLFEAEGVFDWDLYADLPPLLLPSTELSETAMPELSPEWALLPELSPEEAYKCPPSHLLIPPPPLLSGSPSPSTLHLCSRLTTGLPVSIGVAAGGSLVSASSLRVQDSASAHRPMAPSSLLSDMARQSTGSTRLPRPSSYTLGCRQASCAWGLHSSGFTSSLCPSGSIRLLHPSASTLVLCLSGSTTASRIHASTSVAGAIGSTLTLRILLLFTLAHRLSVSASGSSTTCSTAVGRWSAPWSHQPFLLHGASLCQLHH